MTQVLSWSNDPAVYIQDVEKGLKKVFELAAIMSEESSPDAREKHAKAVQRAVEEISRNVESALMTLKLQEFFRTEITSGGPDYDWALVRHKVRIRKRNAFVTADDYREYLHCKISDDVNGLIAIHREMKWSTDYPDLW